MQFRELSSVLGRGAQLFCFSGLSNRLRDGSSIFYLPGTYTRPDRESWVIGLDETINQQITRSRWPPGSAEQVKEKGQDESEGQSLGSGQKDGVLQGMKRLDKELGKWKNDSPFRPGSALWDISLLRLNDW